MTQDTNATPTGLLGAFWHRKWTILAPCVLTAAATAVGSYYFLPTRYQSEVSIIVVPPRVIASDVARVFRGVTAEKLQNLTQQITSRTRLERLMDELKLYEIERGTQPIEELIVKVRKDIAITVTPQDRSGNGVAGFRISFVSSDAHTAQRATERLASLFVQESLRDAEVIGESTMQFIASQIDDLRRQIIESERTLAQKGQNGGRASQADVIEYEVRQETLRTLLARRQESTFAQNMERRQIGEQFRVLEGARLPKQPMGPSRLAVNVTGGFAGLGLGLGLAGVMSFRQRRAA